jgi:predicted enzyme related to lactoylglutathione lyase
MPTRTSYDPGTPCWVDLMSPDVEASKAFYTGLFGWDAEPQSDPTGTVVYALLKKDGHDAAGLGGQPPMMAGAPPVWNSYICVLNADETVAAAEKAGGNVLMPPMDVMEAGRMAVIADPTGAVVSVWQAGAHVGAGIVNEPNAYSWNELLTSDLDAAKRFYGEVFGWDFDGMDMGPMGTYWVIKGGEGGLGGLMGRPPNLPPGVPDHWLVYFMTDDIVAKVDATTAAGGGTMHGPAAIPGVGMIAVLTDPQGGAFALLQPQTA